MPGSLIFSDRVSLNVLRVQLARLVGQPMSSGDLPVPMSTPQSSPKPCFSMVSGDLNQVDMLTWQALFLLSHFHRSLLTLDTSRGNGGTPGLQSELSISELRDVDESGAVTHLQSQGITRPCPFYLVPHDIMGLSLRP